MFTRQHGLQESVPRSPLLHLKPLILIPILPYPQRNIYVQFRRNLSLQVLPDGPALGLDPSEDLVQDEPAGEAVVLTLAAVVSGGKDLWVQRLPQ